MKLSDFYNNKVVLITGASSGIGKSMARQVLEYGGKVIITGRTRDKLIDTKNELNEYSDSIMIHSGDVASYSDVFNLIKEIIDRFGRLDVLINNAGMSCDFAEMEIINERVVHELVDTNIKGSIFVSMAAIPELKKTGGSILFVSSIAALWGLPAYSIYSLSKMALTSLVQSLRVENRKTGLFIGIAYVGFVENEERKRIVSHTGKYSKAATRNKKISSSRSTIANILLTQIAKKKYRVVHSFIGRLTYIICKFCPIIMKGIYTRIYKKQLENSEYMAAK